MNSRKQVMMAIAALDGQLHCQQEQIESHKHELLAEIQNKEGVLFALILSAFFVGWGSARIPSINSRASDVARFLFYAIAANIK